MRHQGKKILSILFTLLMLFSLMPGMKMTAYAAGDPVASVTTSDGTTTEYSDMGSALSAWGSGSTLTMLADAAVGNGINTTGTKTLDLNGHQLTSLVVINDSSKTLTIKDSSNGSGKLIRPDVGGSLIWVKNGTLILEGGTLESPTSDGASGIISLGQGDGHTGHMIMTGGKITGEMAQGAVRIRNVSSFQMSGGEITGVKSPGGVFFYNSGATAGNVTVSGSAKITGNTSDGTTVKNVYLADGQKINVGELNKDASIGISMEKPGVFTAGGAAGGFASNFTSDDDSYTVQADGDELKLGLPHKHSFTYSVNEAGDTITAACTEGCDITEGLSLTISAPDGELVYDEEEKAAALSTGYNTTAFPGEYSISYKQGETALESAPVKAGTYTASVTAEGKTASVEYTIAKAEITPSVSIEGWTYGDQAKTPAVAGNQGDGAVTYTYAEKGSTEFSEAVPTDAGDYTVKAAIAETDNYNGGEATADFSISKADGSKAVPAEVNAWNAERISIGVTEGQEYVIVPKGSKPDWEKAVDGNGEEFVVFEDLTPATEYEIYTRIKGTANTNPGEAVSTDAMTDLYGLEMMDDTVVGETITVKPDPEDAEGLTYQWYYQMTVQEDGEEYIRRGSIIAGADSASYKIQPADYGMTLIVVVSKNGKELMDASYGPVEKKEIKPAVTLEGWAENESPKTPVVTGNEGKGAVTYTYAAKGSTEFSMTVPTKAGDYTVKAAIAETDAYYGGEATADFTIQSVEDNNKDDHKEKVYNYTLASISGTTTDSSHTWTKNSGVDVVLTVKLEGDQDNSFDHFTGVEIDGTALKRGIDYTAKEGSTIVTLKADTVQKLSVGKHTVTIKFDNGKVDTKLTVKEAAKTQAKSDSPRTGDYSHIAIWLALMILSVIVLSGAVLIIRKRRYTK